ncbi:hypothetical protein [Enhygromyxa salina]|uniref:hypothetical protein n=1 Tax=Enhygromyxa salina TaxID=215803 RepID=UPI0015E69634|nr:hypothetical protein [Enhygromyxa salina]
MAADHASDGHEFGAAPIGRPIGQPRAGVVVIREVFGINHHRSSFDPLACAHAELTSA